MASRKYVPPLRVEPEPTTRPAIIKRIAGLQEQRAGVSDLYKAWIDRYIVDLNAKLEKLALGD